MQFTNLFYVKVRFSPLSAGWVLGGADSDGVVCSTYVGRTDGVVCCRCVGRTDVLMVEFTSAVINVGGETVFGTTFSGPLSKDQPEYLNKNVIQYNPFQRVKECIIVYRYNNSAANKFIKWKSTYHNHPD